LADLSIRELVVCIVLIVIGGGVLSVPFPSELVNLQWLGWIPLIGGLGYLVLKVKRKSNG